MTVPILIRRLAERLGVPNYRAGFALRVVVDQIRWALSNGEPVTLHGLGTFRVKRCGSRVIEDFKGRAHVTRGRKVSFKPSKSLRNVLS